MRHKIINWGLRAVSVSIFVSLIFTLTGVVAAVIDSTWTQTSQTDFESGITSQLDTYGSPGDVKLAVAGVDYIYAFRGYYQRTFWKYDTTSGLWTSLANAPDRVKQGGALAYDTNNYIFAFHGNDTNDFWRYDISADSWLWMADAPGTVNEGGSLTYNNGYIYALRGNSSKAFWRYDINTDSWSVLANTYDYVRAGGALTNDGGNYIYSLQCEDIQALWRYDISANAWTLLANVPNLVGNGASLSYDGKRYIYALRGSNTNNFWQYDTITDSWAIKNSIPGAVEWGGSLAYDGTSYVYALAGACTQQYYRYNINTNLWESCVNTPSSVYYGGALASGKLHYYSTGNLTSIAYDTGYTADFNTIAWTANLPSGTAIKFQIASNNDNSSWTFKGPDGTQNTYYTSSGETIWSGHDSNRYIKYKAYFSTTDTIKTPELYDITISYGHLIELPTAVTGEATLVEETTATLNGSISNDGGEPCQYRFQYGLSSGNYSIETNWIGNLLEGLSFGADIMNLGKGTKYYYRAQVKNSTGIGDGQELSLLTKPDPPVENTLDAGNAGDTSILLTWIKGEGAQKTMVRRKLGDYPVDRNDGVLVYFDTGTSVIDTGLTPGVTYYYSAWSQVSGSEQWSDGWRSIAATTNPDGPSVPPVPPLAVGGVVYNVNKMMLLAPWINPTILLIILISLSVNLMIKRK